MSTIGQMVQPSITGAQPTVIPSSSQVVIPQITIPQPTYTPYQPSFTTPQTQFSSQSQQGPQPYKVHGIDGAKQFPTIANGMYALFDDDDDVFYLKVTDKNNYPIELKRYRFTEEAEPLPEAPPEYVTIEKYKELDEKYLDLSKKYDTLSKKMEEVLTNAKQPVRSDSNFGNKQSNNR